MCEKQHTDSLGLYSEGVIVIILLCDPDSRVISVNYYSILQDALSKIDFHGMNVSHMGCMNVDTFRGMLRNVNCIQMQGSSPISAHTPGTPQLVISAHVVC